MTDLPTVTMCDALADNLRDGGHYACFRRPHEDPWHFDNRGLGVSFRIDPHGLTAVIGVLPENADAYIAAHADGLGGGNSSPNPEDWDTGESPRMTAAFAAFSAEEPPVPARLALTGGELDVDAMRAQAPVVRQALLDALRHSATLVRENRGTVVVPEDTYDLVRRLTAAEEVCRQWAQAFTDAAKEAASLIEEEAMTVAGSEQDGVLTSSLFVPDGSGQRIAVRADWRSGESVWDVGSLIGWLIEEEVSNTAAAVRRAGDTQQGSWSRDDAQQVARNVVDRLLALGKFTPYAKQVEVLRKKLAEQQRDSDAAVIRQVRTVGPRQYQGVKITREEQP